MTNSIKLSKSRIQLHTILPSMIFEIVQDYVDNYIKENNISEFNVEFGYIEEVTKISVQGNIIELKDRAYIMTYSAKLIEIAIFNHYKISTNIYEKDRNREILRYRQVIQFFMCYYSDMTLKEIGFVTGKKDHATVMHSRCIILKRAKNNPAFKKEIFLIDKILMRRIGIEHSLIFNKNAELV